MRLSRPLTGFLLLFAALVAIAATAAAARVEVLDQDERTPIEKIARVFCTTDKGNSKQIGRLSTVSKLIEYLERQPPASPLETCRTRSIEALKKFDELAGVSNANVCADEKVRLIEDFHDDYISTHKDRVRSREERNKRAAPCLLKLLFLHYALDVTALCKRNLINNLEWDLSEQFSDVAEFESIASERTSLRQAPGMSALLNGVVQRFTRLRGPVADYDDVLLIWNLLSKSALISEEQLQEDEYDESTGEQIRLYVKVNSTGRMLANQRKCHYKFKPIYEKLIIPIVRLADLGYGSNGEQLNVELEALRESKTLKWWYGIVQICELILPLKLYEDPQLRPNEVSIINKEEAVEMDRKRKEAAAAGGNQEPEEEVRRIEYEPTTNSMESVDLLDSVMADDGQELVGRVNLNLDVRDRTLRRALVYLYRNLKSNFVNLGSKLKLFLSRTKEATTSTSTTTTTSTGSPLIKPPEEEHREQGETEREEFIKEDLSKQLSKSLEHVSEADLLKLDGAGPSRERTLGRKRRRKRRGDSDMISEARSVQVSYRHTQTGEQIWTTLTSWTSTLAALAPTKTQMFAACAIAILLMLLIIIL